MRESTATKGPMEDDLGSIPGSIDFFCAKIVNKALYRQDDEGTSWTRISPEIRLKDD